MPGTNSPTVLFGAAIRGPLGIAQVLGSIASLVLLFRLRAADETMIELGGTMAATILSFFKVLKMQKRA